MAFISNMFSGDKGNGWQASGAEITKPTTVDQANTAYNQAQSGLSQQQAFLQALQAQGGLQNQSDVFQQQQNLANQFQGVANGSGPNPAQAMLNNSTGANIQQQAALMAGQRGASANAGLLARQAAMQGGNIQQQAAGQGAAMQANQSLQALGQLGQQQAQMANVAGQQVANQAGALNNYNQFAQGNQSNILNSIGQQNNAAVGMQSNMNNTQAQIAGINAQSQNKLVGGMLNGVGQMLGLAHGGVVPPGEIAVAAPAPIAVIQDDKPAEKSGGGGSDKGLSAIKSMSIGMADGGVAAPAQVQIAAPAPIPVIQDDKGGGGGPQDMAKMAMAFLSAGGDVKGPRSNVGRHFAGSSMNMAKGGEVVPAMLSPGEKYLPPQAAAQVAQGKVSPDQVGKIIPGQAKVKGDSPKNDIVPAKLEAGGVVIPRSVMDSDDPMKSTIAFVRAHLGRNQAMKGKK